MSRTPPGYSPYAIEADPLRFGLTRLQTASEFGPIYTLRSPTAFNGAPVSLFLHGVGGDWSTWTPLLQEARLQDRDLGPCVLVDIPGFGRSPNHAGHLRAEAVGSALLRMMDELGAGRVRLFGHSMGGFLALDMAGRFPGRVQSVGVVSGTYLTIVETYQHLWRELIAGKDAAAVILLMRCLATLGPLGQQLVQASADTRLFAKVMTRALAHPSQVDPSVISRIARGVRPRSFMQAAANGAHYDCLHQWRIAADEVPIVALFGQEDHLVPVTDYQVVAHEVPGISTHLLRDAGHFAHIEQPAIVLDLLSKLP